MSDPQLTALSIRSGGHSIEYLTAGKGPTLVFLASMARSVKDFAPIAGAVARSGFRMVGVETRGIGASTGPVEGITLHDLADDVAAVIHEVSEDAVIVVGHAFGNWVARCLAADHENMVRGLVLAAASRKGAVNPKLRESISASFDYSLGDAERRSHLRRLFFAPDSDPSVWLSGWYPDVAPYQRAAGEATSQADWWSGGSNVPILDLQGDADPTCPPERTRDLLEEFGSRVTIEVVRGASHAMFPEQPEAIARAIVAFAQRLNLPRTAV